jgi:peptide/nickel transport system permease protein
VLRYAARRSLQGLVVLWGASLVLFGLMHAVPGGPDALYLHNPHLDASALRRVREIFGLDQPLYVQYARWLGQTLRGNLGWSLVDGQPVSDRILERLPATAELMGLSFLAAWAVAVPFGVFSAVRQYSPLDYLGTLAAYAGVSVPAFWFGMVMLVVFSGRLHLLPAVGRGTPGDYSLGDQLRHLILPAAVLSLRQVASWSRFVRSCMLDVIRSDYVRTARAKGLPERLVIYRHALRNALVPVVTVMAVDAALLFSGAVVTETVFAWPGMGRLFWDSLLAADYPVLMGITLVSAALVIAANLAADLACALLDPRIRYDRDTQDRWRLAAPSAGAPWPASGSRGRTPADGA